MCIGGDQNRDRDAEQCYNILIEAIALVGSEYCLVECLRGAPAGENPEREQKYAERVFCYELYHQMRNLTISEKAERRALPQGVVIHGELCKSGLFKQRIGQQTTPDLLFHEPGTMDRNLLAVEVKVNANAHRIGQDLEKLSKYLSDEGQYAIGVSVLIDTTEPCVPEVEVNGRLRVVWRSPWGEASLWGENGWQGIK